LCIRLIPVDVQLRLETLHLSVARDVPKQGVAADQQDQAIGAGLQLAVIDGAHDVLEPALADSPADTEVLKRVEVDIHARNRPHVASQFLEHPVQGGRSFRGFRLIKARPWLVSFAP
jgi:hypothetical protein